MIPRSTVVISVVFLGLLLAALFYVIRTGAGGQRALTPVVESDKSLVLHRPSDLTDVKASGRELTEVHAGLNEGVGAKAETDRVLARLESSLRFRVLHPDGQAAASAPILIVQFADPPSDRSWIFDGRLLMTDDYGRADWTVESLLTEVIVYPPRWTHGESSTRSIKFELTPGETMDLGDLYLEAVVGPSIVGRFVDQSGRPQPALEAVLWRSFGDEQAAISDLEGRFGFVNVEHGSAEVCHFSEPDRGTKRGDVMRLLPRAIPVLVSDESPAVIDVGTITVHIDPYVYVLHVHPPADVLPSTVSAYVTSTGVPKGQLARMDIDEDGVATWNPWGGEHGLTQTVRVNFVRQGGPDQYESTFTIVPGKIERRFIP